MQPRFWRLTNGLAARRQPTSEALRGHVAPRGQSAFSAVKKKRKCCGAKTLGVVVQRAEGAVRPKDGGEA